jgi:hypothetical protein
MNVKSSVTVDIPIPCYRHRNSDTRRLAGSCDAPRSPKSVQSAHASQHEIVKAQEQIGIVLCVGLFFTIPNRAGLDRLARELRNPVRRGVPEQPAHNDPQLRQGPLA